jgi:hypothetical protein
MLYPAKCLVWMAPKYQLNHGNKEGNTELNNMLGMTAADNAHPPTQNYILTKKNYIIHNGSSVVECQIFLLVKLTPIPQICSK